MFAAPWLVYIITVWMELPKLPIMLDDYLKSEPYYGFSNWMSPVQEISRSDSHHLTLMFHLIVALAYIPLAIKRLHHPGEKPTAIHYVVDSAFAVSVLINFVRFGQTSKWVAAALNGSLLLLMVITSIVLAETTLSILLTAIFLEAYLRSIGLFALLAVLWVPFQAIILFERFSDNRITRTVL